MHSMHSMHATHRRAVGRCIRLRCQHRPQQLPETEHVSGQRSMLSMRPRRRSMLGMCWGRAAQQCRKAGIGDQDAAAISQQNVAAGRRRVGGGQEDATRLQCGAGPLSLAASLAWDMLCSQGANVFHTKTLPLIHLVSLARRTWLTGCRGPCAACRADGTERPQLQAPPLVPCTPAAA